MSNLHNITNEEQLKKQKEERAQRILNWKPNRKFHDFHTIKWLRRRVDEKWIKKSIYTLLPDNGRPVVDPEESNPQKHMRLWLEWLSTHCQPKDKFKNVNINPKYFFNNKAFEKVLKLKEIFLEFDEDGSRKMEIDEMVEMFEQNNINATITELVSLFFKDQVIPKDEIMSLYLDFYQFMEFALTKDQDFRLFMRKIKEKYKLKNADETGFLPMNFNLVLDYFINKGKERNSIQIISNAVEEMDKIIGENDAIKSKDDVDSISNSENNKDAKSETKGDDDSQLEKINFYQIIQEFSNLFHIKEEEKNSQQKQNKKKISKKASRTRTVSIGPTRRNSDPKLNEKEVKTEDNENNYIFRDMVDTHLNQTDIHKMNYWNYLKYHSWKLALDETKRQINEKYNMNSNENLSRKSTMYGTMGMLPKINQANNKKEAELNGLNKTTYSKKSQASHQVMGDFNRRKKSKNDYVPFEIWNSIK